MTKPSRSSQSNKRVTLIAVLAIILALCLVCAASCDDPLFSNLKGITAEYKGGDVEVGGTLNKEDVVVTARYRFQKYEVVTDFDLEYDFSTVGQREVIVFYEPLCTTFTVNVVEKSVDPDPKPIVALESITAVYNGQGIKVGDKLGNGDIVVMAYYDDDSSAIVTNYQTSDLDTSSAGEKTITITYTEGGLVRTCEVTIIVAEDEPPVIIPTLESIAAVYVGENIEVGGTLNNAEIVVTACYSNNTSKTVSDFAVDGFSSDAAGEKEVTVTYTEGEITKTCAVTITVEDDEPPITAVTLESITAVYNGDNIKVGGTLNNDDIVVTAYYSDDSIVIITNFAVSGFSAEKAGICSVTVSYAEDDIEKECALNITIVEDSQQVVSNSNLSVHFLELGNQYTGDCVYIKAGETDILIDAGSRKNSADTLIKYINKYVTDGKLEYVIVTHEHQDHISGFMGLSGQKGIFEQYQCENIIDFPKYKSSLTTASGADSLLGEYIKARDAEVAAGANHYTALDCVNNANGAQKVYDLTGDGTITMEILYQKHYEVYSADENNYSVCVMINQKIDSANTNHYLFTGDLEESGEKSLVENNPNLPEMVLFKGGHHGSYTATNEVLLQKIKPQYVCICCCAGNVEYLTGTTQDLSHSFPAQEMINRIAKYTDEVYVTTLGKIKRNDTDTKWVNDGYESMNGNIVLSCVNGEISLNCSNNNLKLKDTEWFKKNRECPPEWKNVA